MTVCIIQSKLIKGRLIENVLVSVYQPLDLNNMAKPHHIRNNALIKFRSVIKGNRLIVSQSVKERKN